MESVAGGRHPREARQSPLLPPDSLSDSSAVRSRAGSGRRACSEACGEHAFSGQSSSACGTAPRTPSPQCSGCSLRESGEEPLKLQQECAPGEPPTQSQTQATTGCVLPDWFCLPPFNPQLRTYPAELIPTARSLGLPFRQPRASVSISSAPRTPSVEELHPPYLLPYSKASV